MDDSLLNDSFYPNSLTYGLLAYHCSNIERNKNVTGGSIENEISSYISSVFIEMYKIDSNLGCEDKIVNTQSYIENYLKKHLKGWKALEKLDDVESGYFGIIYFNEKSQQIVLSHRSTDFEYGLKTTKGLLNGSGVKEDIDGVIKTNLTFYQAQGFIATKKAIDYVKEKYKNYSLSFTGHSLGAWMAQLSVFYCIDFFKYEAIQAITFDGPGAYEIFFKMNNNFIKETFKGNIISYLSAPNLVNCTNNHVGQIYRIFPKLKNKIGNEWEIDNKFFGNLCKISKIDRIDGLITSTFYGHNLDYILPYFDILTGQPYKSLVKKIEKWPIIDFTKFSNSINNQSKKMNIFKNLSDVKGIICEVANFGLKLIFNDIRLDINNSTLSSLFIFLFELSSKSREINFNQFWLVHKYLDKNNHFSVKPLNLIDHFFLDYEAHYREEDIDKYHIREITSNDMDRCLFLLYNQFKKNKKFIQSKNLLDILNKIEVNPINNTIDFHDIENYLAEDTMRKLFYRDPDFVLFVKNLNMPRLNPNIIQNHEINEKENERIRNSLLNKKLVIFKGIFKCGKTEMAKSFCIKNELEFTSYLINANSEKDFSESFKELIPVEFIHKNTGTFTNKLTELKDHLSKTKQKVLFILDNVKNETNPQLDEFFEHLKELNNVKFIVTTRCDTLKINKNKEYVTTQNITLEIPLKNDSFNKDFLKTEFDSLNENLKNLMKMISCYDFDCLIFGRYPNLGCINELKNNSFLSEISISNRIYLYVNQDCHLNTIISNYEFTGQIKEIFDLSTSKIIIEKFSNLLLTINSDEINKKLENFMGNCDLFIKSRFEKNLKEIILRDEIKNSKIYKILLAFKEKLQDEIKESFNILFDKFASYSKDESYEQTLEIIDNQEELNFLLEKLNSSLEPNSSSIEVKEEHKIFKNFAFIGNSSSGKSTIINFLLGNELKCVQKGTRIRPQWEIHVNSELPNYNPGPKIGNNKFKSETELISKYVSQERKHVYWDFPGFHDSRGLVQNIKNAILINMFTEKIKHFNFILVLNTNDFKTSKGDGFIKIIELLHKLCSVENLESSLSIILTKCEEFKSIEELKTSDIDELKKAYLNDFQDIFKLNENLPFSKYIEIFTKKEMLPRMAFFANQNVDRSFVADESFISLNDILQKKSSTMSFSLSLDGDDQNKINRLMMLLASYLKLLLDKHLIYNVKNHFTILINDISINKEKIRKEIEKFGNLEQTRLNQTTRNDIDSILNRLYKLPKNTNYRNTVTKILKSYQFLNNLLDKKICSLSEFCSNSLNYFIQLIFRFEQISEKSLFETKYENLVICNSPLLTASELNEIYSNKNLKFNKIIARSLLFVLDVDIEMPSIDLAIYCERWNILGERKKINLSGNKDFPNSGSFFSDVIEINGADVEIYLNGWNGSDGSFDISNILQYIEQNKKEIEEKRKELKYLINFQNLLLNNEFLRDLVQIYKSESFYEKFERLKNEKTDQEKEDLFKKIQDFFMIKISCFSYFNEHKDEIKRELENIIKEYQLLDKNKDAEDKESFVESCTKINTKLENFSNNIYYNMFDQQLNTKKKIEIFGMFFDLSANDLEDIDKAIINLEKQIHAQEIKIIDQNKLEEHLKDYNNLTLKIKDLEKDIYEQLEKIDNDSNNEDNLNKDLFKKILSLKGEIEQSIAKHYIKLDSEKDSKSIEKISKVFVDFKEIIENVKKTINELEKLQKLKSNSDSNLENETKCFKIVKMDYLFKKINSQVDYISQKFKFFKEESFQIIFHSDDSISQSNFIQKLEFKDILKNLSELHSTLKTKCGQIKNAEKKLKNFLNKINYDSLKNYELKRNKCVEFILKSLFGKNSNVYNTIFGLNSYYLLLKGSDGENGGNSGVNKTNNNKFLVFNMEGKGGRNGPSLKGIYTCISLLGYLISSLAAGTSLILTIPLLISLIAYKYIKKIGGYFSKGPYLIESTITAKDGTVANEKRFMMHLKEIEDQIENPFNCKNLNDFLIQIKKKQ